MSSLFRCAKKLNIIGSFRKANMFDKTLQYKIENFAPLPIAKYGGRYMVTVLTGLSADEELQAHVDRVFTACSVPIDFEYISIADIEDFDDKLDVAIKAIHRNGIALIGNLQTTQKFREIWSKNIIRRKLDLQVAVMHCKSYPGVPARKSNVDAVIVRQNTEAEYSMLEHETVKGIVEHMKIITRKASLIVAKYAFEYAKKHNRKRVTTIHHQRLMQLADGMFLDSVRTVAEDYPDIEHDWLDVDKCALKLVTNPESFDILLSTHLYGSIMATILCGLTSGTGLYPFVNFGKKVAVFEPGFPYDVNEDNKDRTNPVAYLNAGVALLEFLKLNKEAELIRNAIDKTINQNKIHTEDLGGNSSTTEVVNKIIDNLSVSRAKTFKTL